MFIVFGYAVDQSEFPKMDTKYTASNSRPPAPRPYLIKSFFTGMSVLIPVFLTVYILEAFVEAFDQILAFLPVTWRTYMSFPGAGLIIVFTVATVVGMLVRNYFGKFIVDQFNRLIEHVPLVASVYKMLRQVSEAVLGDNKKSFNRVVMVEWPRKDLWSLAFVTGEKVGYLGDKLMREGKGDGFISVFIPTTPNPTAGFYFLVPEKDTIALRMNVDQAFKVIISMGAIEFDPRTAAHRRPEK